MVGHEIGSLVRSHGFFASFAEEDWDMELPEELKK